MEHILKKSDHLSQRERQFWPTLSWRAWEAKPRSNEASRLAPPQELNISEGDTLFPTHGVNGGLRITAEDPNFAKQMKASSSATATPSVNWLSERTSLVVEGVHSCLARAADLSLRRARRNKR
jgi:hypothetical protein